jgi:hypothetical protein
MKTNIEWAVAVQAWLDSYQVTSGVARVTDAVWKTACELFNERSVDFYRGNTCSPANCPNCFGRIRSLLVSHMERVMDEEQALAYAYQQQVQSDEIVKAIDETPKPVKRKANRK